MPLVNWTFAKVPAGLLRRAKLTPTVLYRHGVSVFMIVLATILAGLLFDSAIDLGARPRDAFGITLLVVLSPPLLIYSVLFFTELLSALLCFYAFRQIALDNRELRLAALESGVGSGANYWMPVGAAVGLLMLVHVRNAGLVIGLVILALLKILRLRSSRDFAGFALGLGATLLVRTILTYDFWGTLVTTPHGNLGAWTGWGPSAREAATRLAGLFFDQEYGLLIYAPVYALAIAGLAVTERAVARAIVIVAGCYLALILSPVTNVHGWTGGGVLPAGSLCRSCRFWRSRCTPRCAHSRERWSWSSRSRRSRSARTCGRTRRTCGTTPTAWRPSVRAAACRSAPYLPSFTGR